MKLNLEQANKLCEELWEWMSNRNNILDKFDWPGWKRSGGQYTADMDCFYCDYAHHRYNDCELRYTEQVVTCDFCPLFRVLGMRCTNSDCGYYRGNLVEFLAQIKKVRQGGMKAYHAGLHKHVACAR